MRAILHIGTEKTGTTSCQMFMHQHRQGLLAQGVLYPERLGGINHRAVASYALSMESADDYLVGRGLTTQEKLDEFYADVEAELDEQIGAHSEAHTCVLSSEHFHSRLKSIEQITRIRDLLVPCFEQIEVHVHLRPQIDVAISLASTQSRVGGRVGQSFFDQVRADRMYYNYDMLVSAWEQVFGSENVYCLPFSATPDYLGWLAARIGIDLKQFPKPERVNEALDVRVMAMVNALVDSGSKQRIDFRVLDRLPVAERLKLDEATARRIQHRFEESNRHLIARREDLNPGQLQPEWRKFPKEGNFHLLDQGCAFSTALADLVTYYNDVIKERRNLS
jgi:hypothetical protein